MFLKIFVENYLQETKKKHIIIKNQYYNDFYAFKKKRCN